MAKFSASPSLDSLLDLACRDGVDIRPTLLRVLTDLYVQKPTHSADEETQYVELVLGLIEAADEPTRVAVRTRLEAYPAAPAVVLDKLAGTDASVGSNRDKTETHDLVELFFAATSEERRLILANLDAAPGLWPGRPSPETSEVIRRLEAAALQLNSGEFSRMLERALGISRALAARITHDQNGEPIVIAARALGMKAAVLQRVLLFLNPVIGESVERVYDLARLFDELTPAAAERMVEIWREAGQQPRPTHAPQHWDDERRCARLLATPALHRAVPHHDAAHSLLKTSKP